MDQKLIQIKAKGVVCTSDIGLVRPFPENRRGYDAPIPASLYVLSIYGSSQQVKAIFATLAQGEPIEMAIDDQEYVVRRTQDDTIRFRGYGIGYGKQHALIFAESNNISFWLNADERLKHLDLILSKGKIPYDKAWLPGIEKLLVGKEHLAKLTGWGGLDGYLSDWKEAEEDALCDLISNSIEFLEANASPAASLSAA